MKSKNFLKMQFKALFWGSMDLETERLVLREWEDGDMEPFYQMSSDPIVMKYFPALLSKNDSERFFEKMKAHFAEFGYGLWVLKTK